MNVNNNFAIDPNHGRNIRGKSKTRNARGALFWREYFYAVYALGFLRTVQDKKVLVVYEDSV